MLKPPSYSILDLRSPDSWREHSLPLSARHLLILEESLVSLAEIGVTEFCSQVKCNGAGGQESYQGLTQALGALLDWAEELLKSTHSLWWLTGFRQSTCRRRG